MRVHLDQLQAKARLKLEKGELQQVIKKAQAKIRARLRPPRGRQRKAAEAQTPGQQKQVWARELAEKLRQQRQRNPGNAPEDRQQVSDIKRHFRRVWEVAWEGYRQGVPEGRRPPALQEGLTKERLHRFDGLAKAESSLAVQIRSEKIGLRGFLHACRVPGYESPACSCRWGWQNAKHILMHCQEYAEHRQFQAGTAQLNDYRTMVNTRSGLRLLTRQLMLTGLLNQYRLASECLYGASEL